MALKQQSDPDPFQEKDPVLIIIQGPGVDYVLGLRISPRGQEHPCTAEFKSCLAPCLCLQVSSGH